MASLGHPSKFQRVSRLGFVTLPTSLNGRQPNFARCLAVLLRWYTIYTFSEALAGGAEIAGVDNAGVDNDGILPTAKFTLRPSVPFSYIGSVTARHSSSGRQPKFAAWYKKWNYGTFAEGATYIRQGRHQIT